MSFNSFRPFDEKPPSFWKQLLLATLPAFIASVAPGVIMHYLQKYDSKPEEPKNKDEKSDATVDT